jgi:hypothetical protein
MMRKACAALAAGLLLLVARSAVAQSHTPRFVPRPTGTPPGAPAGQKDPGPLNLKSVQLGSVGLAGDAREKMRAGDCAGALDLFDQALATSTDPALYRDRGSCHEKLGHPYPAMDDYRAYLTNAADAPDAAAVHERLLRLEEQTFGAATSTGANDDIPPSEPIVSDAASPASQPSGSRPPASTDTGPVRDEDEDEELKSPLRAGKGFGLAPVFGARKWLRDGASFGASQTWAEAVGIEIRYATAPHGAVVLDLGYEHFDSTGVDSEVIAGFTSFLGYELRFPLNARYDDQLTLAPGVGYEQLGFSPNNSALSEYSEGGITGRLRFGYRHMLASSVSIDVDLEGGAAYFFKFDSAVDAHDSPAGLVGARVALVWGL